MGDGLYLAGVTNDDSDNTDSKIINTKYNLQMSAVNGRYPGGLGQANAKNNRLENDNQAGYKSD